MAAYQLDQQQPSSNGELLIDNPYTQTFTVGTAGDFLTTDIYIGCCKDASGNTGGTPSEGLKVSLIDYNRWSGALCLTPTPYRRTTSPPLTARWAGLGSVGGQWKLVSDMASLCVPAVGRTAAMGHHHTTYRLITILVVTQEGTFPTLIHILGGFIFLTKTRPSKLTYGRKPPQ
jgi:hypothetical protein